ncbi:MAG TPA: nucleotide pyrophosphohydrolase [Cellvibrio sp.]|nr:nucleotide pyrophosphohydrolase [Cellvibrio sp.]
MATTQPSDQHINLSQIVRDFREIAALNDWQAYHTPKNLASAVAVEASELLAEFQWLTAEQSHSLSAEQKQRIAYEMADVLMYLGELSEQLAIDLGAAINAKIQLNKLRFSGENQG